MATDETERKRPAWGERELKHFEERLLDERKRAVAQMGQFFGQCEECGQRIGYERLDAIPYVVRCVNFTLCTGLTPFGVSQAEL